MKSTTKKIKTTLAGVAALFAVFAPSFVSAQESSTYTVKEGDTLQKLLKLTTQQLRNWQKTTTLTTSI